MRVDRRDDSVYVVGAELRKCERNGHLLFSTALGDPDVRGLSLAIDPTWDVWVGTRTDVRRYSTEGKLVLSTQRFVNPSTTWVAMRALPVTLDARLPLRKANEQTS